MKVAGATFIVAGAGADLGGGCRGCAPPPEMTCGFLIQLVFMTALLTVSLTVKIPKIDELHHFIIEVLL